MSTNFDWMNFIDISGPFLSEPVLNEKLPHGLDAVSTKVASQLRKDYEEWREAVEENDPYLSEIHDAWIHEVLCEILEYDDVVLRREGLPENLNIELPEYGIILKPDMVLCEPTNPDATLMLLSVFEPKHDLNVPFQTNGFVANAKDRMISMLKASECSVGLVTNGEMWMLVFANDGSISSTATWHARMFSQERETLRAFSSLLGIYRFTGPATDRIGSLLQQSVEHQGNVTEELGAQVSAAIEVLMRALDRADQDRNRELLKDIEPKELYEAGLTLMMRLVVVLCAEERDLLLIGDPIYDAHYAISTMRSDLVATDPAILSNREEAWSRLLATFRLIYSGSDHPDLRLAALGGSLFDPDKYPFLEGRRRGTTWESHPSSPLPIDDRTVLLLLDALQSFKGRKLSYKALDVEQIGHVYEGLLEQTAEKVTGVSVQLKGSTRSITPITSVDEIEKLSFLDRPSLIKFLEEQTGRSENAIKNDLDRRVEKFEKGKLVTSCRGNTELANRIIPFLNIIALDPWEMPLVHQEGAIVLIKGLDRRETGSHYTPKSLTEKVVEETLTPIVFEGPSEGKERKDWLLKSPKDILNLKICDPAMGSGAFLVQVCRWLSDRLVESWGDAESSGFIVGADGKVYKDFASISDPLSNNLEERTIEARRLIAEKCLYGVDVNPLAVELAKLSLWLTTAAKARPFGFLDHNLRSGDSLLGIHNLQQLEQLDFKPNQTDQLRLFGQTIQKAVGETLQLRASIREQPIRDIEDVKIMARLDLNSQKILQLPKQIADAFVGCILAEQKAADRRAAIEILAALADSGASDYSANVESLAGLALEYLAKDSPNGLARRPFHWPLEFPEVFLRQNGGFDAFVGNPPFIGGQKITGAMGTSYREYLVENIAENMRGSADFVAYFFLRTFSLLSDKGIFGLIAVNTIAEGDTRDVGLGQLLSKGADILAAYPNEIWPGKANVITSRIHLAKFRWNGNRILSGKEVEYISAYLGDTETWAPKKLEENANKVFQGSIILGDGFLIDKDFVSQAVEYDDNYQQILSPYLIGREVNRHPEHAPGRYVINFFDWQESDAMKFSLAYQKILSDVKPERQRLTEKGDYALRRPLPQRWWQYAEKRPALYHTIGRGSMYHNHPDSWTNDDHYLENVIVFATGATKYPCFTMVPNEYIFANTLCVIASDSFSLLACLSSDLHAVWAWEHGSRMKQDLRYTHGDVFETFPFPTGVLENDNDDLTAIGKMFFAARRSVMTSDQKGMTSFYNDYHNPEKNSKEVEYCRKLQAELNQCLVSAYQMDDIDLELDFHEVGYLPIGKNTRFTISEKARHKVITRLAELNRDRHYEEINRKSLKRNLVKPKSKKNNQAQSVSDTPNLNLDLSEAPIDRIKQIKKEVIKFLSTRGGKHGRTNLFSNIRMKNSEWETSITELVDEGLVIRSGDSPNEIYTIGAGYEND